MRGALSGRVPSSHPLPIPPLPWRLNGMRTSAVASGLRYSTVSVAPVTLTGCNIDEISLAKYRKNSKSDKKDKNNYETKEIFCDGSMNACKSLMRSLVEAIDFGSTKDPFVEPHIVNRPAEVRTRKPPDPN